MNKDFPKYNPKEIEPKWQQAWEDKGLYKADLNSAKPKYVGFGMFNYPSGAGIHIGHGKNFTLPDVITRAKRQQGYEAYMPVGFDSFGLPAENYAIKTGTPPAETTIKSIANFRTQYKAFGWGMDWSKEIDTSDPEYYRWTQWCFTQLFNNGLAYQKESPQWWCNACKTVLANEQVTAGMCWRHDKPGDEPVVKKNLHQWFFKITDYADELLEATDDLDWTDFVKVMQKNWIGRSQGAIVKFDLVGPAAGPTELEVFTTAYDTIYGATFMVISPEHPLLAEFDSVLSDQPAVAEYKLKSAQKSELQREIEKDKTGVQIEGWYVVNPANGAKLPVWVADYVMMGYGTGAIMAVPGGDARDNEFAKKYDLDIVPIAEGHDFIDYGLEIKSNKASFTVANSAEFSGMNFDKANKAILSKLESANKAEVTVQYKMRDWLLSRQRYWGAPIPIIHCPDHGAVAVPDDQLPVRLPFVDNYAPTGEAKSVLAGVEEWVNTTCPTCGGPAKRETDTMDGYVCSSWYFLRYLDPHNTAAAWDPDKINDWMPIDFYNGGDHATAHLLYARFFARFFYKQGMLKTPEPFKKMYYHGKIMAPDGTAFSKSAGNGVDPLEIIASGYGADALRLYICFIAPPDLDSPWNDDGVPGTYRFLNRIWVLAQEFMASIPSSTSDAAVVEQLENITHKTIHKVNEDLEAIKLNTAVASMMEMVNELYKLKQTYGMEANSSTWQTSIEALLQLLAPFAPHMTEELWSQLGHSDSINVNNWPAFDSSKVIEQHLKIAVQVNGKLKGALELAVDTPKEEIISQAKKLHKVQLAIEGLDIKKEIYVPGKIVNLVV